MSLFTSSSNPLSQSKARSIALLEQAVRSLEEQLAEEGEVAAPMTTEAAPASDLSKIFVVHGHDEGAREAIARFIEALGFQPIILHERANEGRTVIEKVEAHGDVGFAVVLLTPDDEGCVKGGTAGPRARQNVVLELGYFIGRLGRNRVCALKRGELEIPSDFGGVVYEPFDSSGGWKLALGRELRAAGFEIDWNKVHE
jgi:predicted nucleotide-binding protein